MASILNLSLPTKRQIEYYIISIYDIHIYIIHIGLY